jgi:hypothetical protein
VKAWEIGIMWNKGGNIHGERCGNTGKTEGQGMNQRNERKFQEEGETGVQQQLQRKVALDYGSVLSEARAWFLQGPLASHHW